MSTASAGDMKKRVGFRVDAQSGSEPGGFTVTFHGQDGYESTGAHFELTAGKVGTWALSVSVTERVAAGGGFVFFRRGFLLAHRTQDYNPRGRDYVTLESSLKNARLELIVNSDDPHHIPSFARVVVTDGELAPGDVLVLRVGDRRHGGAGSEVYDSTTVARFVAAVDSDGCGRFRELAASPVRVTMLADPQADMLHVLAPSIVALGEPFALHVIAFDRHHNVCTQYDGRVVIQAPGEVDGLPESLRFGPEHEGICVVEHVRIARPGVFRVELFDEKYNLQAVSNPTVCRADSKPRLLWGDLHSHSWGDTQMGLIDESSFKLDPAARHRQAREIGRLDFCAPGPMHPPDQAELPELWQDCQQAYDDNDQPGKYVPFLAYEAHTGPGGDRNIVFRGREEGYLPTKSSMPAVVAQYGRRDDVFLEAHVGGGPPRWDIFATQRERLVEVTSGHGSFGWVLQRALAHGYRPAVIGSGDTHLPALGAPMAAHTFRGRFNSLNIRDTGFGSGPVAGVWASECTREAIWSAVEQRRTFATTGARIVLEVTVNGHPAGSEIEINGAAEVRINVHACTPVERVDLIRSDRCLHSWRPRVMDAELGFVDQQPLKEGLYYIRLRQQDGEYAWSTPVWTRCAGGTDTPAGDLPMWNEHEPVDLDKLRPNPAEIYEKDLLHYLETEEDLSLFSRITPVRIVREVTGRSALFYAFMGSPPEPVSIRWYYEFDMPRIHLDDGWRDFGMRPR